MFNSKEMLMIRPVGIALIRFIILLIAKGEYDVNNFSLHHQIGLEVL